MSNPPLASVPPERRRCVALEGTCQGHSLAVDSDGEVRCLTHTTDAVRMRTRDERNLAGGLNRRRRLEGEADPNFESKKRIRQFLSRLAGATLRNEVDPKLVDTAVRCASTAASTHDDEAMERLDRLEARLFGAAGASAPLFAERRG